MSVRLVSNNGNRPAATRSGVRRTVVPSGCLLFLALLGYLDYVTGYEMSFFVFYSVPVGIAAWYLGRWPAIALALSATGTWLLADYFSGAKYSAPFFYYWNSMIHFAAFIINAVTIAKIKSELDHRHVLAAELESTREALRAVSALVSACPACGKPRDRGEADGEAEIATLARAHPELADSFCPDCRNNGGKPLPATPANWSAA